jgi:hypothetical protein
MRSVELLHDLKTAIEERHSLTDWSVDVPPLKINATVVGRLRKANLETLVMPLGGSGFGFGGLFPAGLETIAVREIVVKQTEPRGEARPDPSD